MSPRKGWCVWLTGLPGSGKTTIAKELKNILKKHAICAQIVSSDVLRKFVTPNPKYTEELSFTHSKFIFRVATSSGNIFFNWNDAWAYHLGDGKIIVGISDYLQQNLSDILFCEFPDIGSQIDQFEAVATLESSKTVNEVLTPFSGKIIAINPRLKDEPELINMDPYKDGWIVMIQATNFEEEKEDLMDSKAYFEFMKEKVEEEGIH